jgi:spermidine/putrescine transport system substrate-binding protein
MTQRRVSRRELFRYAGAGAGALGLAQLLAACGVGGSEGARPTPAGEKSLGPITGELSMANWPAYIDKAGSKSPTIEQFKRQTGIDLKYKVEVNDNDEFYGTDLRPQLVEGQATGWDIVVLTDWLIAKMIGQGWLEELDHDLIPNFAANADEKFKDPSYDPGNAHSVPWAAGITGIGYNRELTGRDITSIEDLFDPAFAGSVGMFKEMRDTYNFMFYLEDIEPTEATLDDVEQATEKLRQQVEDGIVRAYYGNDYLDQLAAGNLSITMAWSGDVFGLLDPDIKFVVPREGGNRWTDNMCIPLGAEHQRDAHEFMNFVYRPDIATQITEWVWYESPVAQVQETIQKHANGPNSGDLSCSPYCQDLANSDLVWPTEETLSQLHGYKLLDLEEERAWQELFQTVTQG